MQKSPKELLITTRYLREEHFAGGILACANHAAGFCDQVDMVTVLGAADSREDFIRAHLKPNVTPHVLPARTTPARSSSAATSSRPSSTRCSRSRSSTRASCRPRSRRQIERAPREGAADVRRGDRGRLRPRLPEPGADPGPHRGVAVPGRQRADQQRQSRLQLDQQVPAGGLRVHRRAGGAAGRPRPAEQPGGAHRARLQGHVVPARVDHAWPRGLHRLRGAGESSSTSRCSRGRSWTASARATPTSR